MRNDEHVHEPVFVAHTSVLSRLHTILSLEMLDGTHCNRMDAV